MSTDLDLDIVKQWRSILTLIVFMLINVPILWPFRMPLYVPRVLLVGLAKPFSTLRLCQAYPSDANCPSKFARFDLPVNYVTAPLTATSLLLATTAISWQEVLSGIVGNGSTGITPYDVVIVFLTLGYVANSIAASGFVRYLVCVVLPKEAIHGHRLYLYLYLSFLGLGMFIGNDPIMLLFLSSLTRVTENVSHPRAWIHTQFAIANIATGVLVSSNPTNLVLAGAFDIKFVGYMANMIVPATVTVLLLFPFLLYIFFHDNSLIPKAIQVHTLPDEDRNREPYNINIPFSRGYFVNEDEEDPGDRITIDSILNPYWSKSGASAGSFVMFASVATLLALNAIYLSKGGSTDFWVTLPAAFLMVCLDLASDWFHRKESRKISWEGRQRAKVTLAERKARRHCAHEEELGTLGQSEPAHDSPDINRSSSPVVADNTAEPGEDGIVSAAPVPIVVASMVVLSRALESQNDNSKLDREAGVIFISEEDNLQMREAPQGPSVRRVLTNLGVSGETSLKRKDFRKERVTLLALLEDRYVWARASFSTTTVAATYLLLDIIPLAFSTFTLVEGLLSKGWMSVFARDWDWWATHTGVVGSIAGMGCLGAVLSNFAGANIGACIFLSQVIKSWQDIHKSNSSPISNRLFWGTVYALSVGVNYGAFSFSISASLTGIMWRTMLKKEGQHLGRLSFARINLPIVAMAMFIACSVLTAQVYVMRSDMRYDA